MTLPIDEDDQTTWPPQVIKIVNKWAEQYKGTTRHTCDLALSLDDENEFRKLLSGHLLRAYHCTRLLPHEVRMIKETGLRPLSANLLCDRINALQEARIINHEEAEELRKTHVFATGEQQNRENKVCFTLSMNTFRHNFDGCKPLLYNWGGEGMYMSYNKSDILNKLTSLSKATVVVAFIDLGQQNSPHAVFPALHKVFVGAALHFSDIEADVMYKALVPPKHIERIQPFKELGIT